MEGAQGGGGKRRRHRNHRGWFAGLTGGSLAPSVVLDPRAPARGNTALQQLASVLPPIITNQKIMSRASVSFICRPGYQRTVFWIRRRGPGPRAERVRKGGDPKASRPKGRAPGQPKRHGVHDALIMPKTEKKRRPPALVSQKALGEALQSLRCKPHSEKTLRRLQEHIGAFALNSL